MSPGLWQLDEEGRRPLTNGGHQVVSNLGDPCCCAKCVISFTGVNICACMERPRIIDGKEIGSWGDVALAVKGGINRQFELLENPDGVVGWGQSWVNMARRVWYNQTSVDGTCIQKSAPVAAVETKVITDMFGMFTQVVEIPNMVTVETYAPDMSWNDHLEISLRRVDETTVECRAWVAFENMSTPLVVFYGRDTDAPLEATTFNFVNEQSTRDFGQPCKIHELNRTWLPYSDGGTATAQICPIPTLKKNVS